jgi:hypothetical protein
VACPRGNFDAEPAPLSVETDRATLVIIDVRRDFIDKKFVNVSAFALAGAALTFFGLMHGEAVGIAVTPPVAVAYGIVAVFLYALSRYPALAPVLTGAGAVMATIPAE